MSPRRLFTDFTDRAAKALLGIATCVSATACFSTVVKSGAPAAAAVVEYDEKWHSGVIYGIAEVSGPYDLSKICPQGWAEIKTETSFVNGFVQLVTFNLYNPQSVTIRCAAGAAPPMPSGAPAPPGIAPLSAPPPAPPPVSPPPAH